MGKKILVGVSGLIVFITTVKVNAEVLDQQFDFAPDGQGSIRTGINRAQTFTVGVTGKITRIELRLYRDTSATLTPLNVDVRGTVGGVPVVSDSAALASTVVPAANFPVGSDGNAPFFSIDLSASNGFVSAGNVLAVALASPDDYEWMIKATGGYPGGSEFINNTGGSWNVGSRDDDFAFRTFVEPADYNGDSFVDAADYVVWRKYSDDLNVYNVWRANFGTTPAARSTVITSVPEPVALSGLVTAAAWLILLRRMPSGGTCTGAAWLSSVASVRCRVKSLNERNPCRYSRLSGRA